MRFRSAGRSCGARAPRTVGTNAQGRSFQAPRSRNIITKTFKYYRTCTLLHLGRVDWERTGNTTLPRRPPRSRAGAAATGCSTKTPLKKSANALEAMVRPPGGSQFALGLRLSLVHAQSPEARAHVLQMLVAVTKQPVKDADRGYLRLVRQRPRPCAEKANGREQRISTGRDDRPTRPRKPRHRAGRRRGHPQHWCGR